MQLSSSFNLFGIERIPFQESNTLNLLESQRNETKGMRWVIKPKFETPMPALQAAVFPPALKELPPPSLDLYDLDEQFASEKIKMAQLTNKCTDEDVDYYIKECGDILGVSQQINNPDDPKAILHYIFQEIVKYKSS